LRTELEFSTCNVPPANRYIKNRFELTFFRKSISWISHGAKVGNEHASIYKLADQAEGRVLKWHFVKLVTSKTTKRQLSHSH